MEAQPRQAELAAFLRSRRERLRPELVGLPTGGRRRTPGLRREEVAQLAGVGVTWYTWLEQGRPIRASEAVLGAIAGALRLDPSERAHLLTLAGLPVPDGLAVRRPPPTDPGTERVLAALPYPALVVSASHTYMAWNDAALHLVGDLRTLEPERRNSMWLIFTEPSWRKLLYDWEREAPHLVALYRGAMADHVGERQWQDLVDELSAVSADFRRIWEDHAVAQPTPRVKSLLHPHAGLLRLETTNFWLGPAPGSRMIVYTPADADAAEALRRLADTEPFADWCDLTRNGGSGTGSAT